MQNASVFGFSRQGGVSCKHNVEVLQITEWAALAVEPARPERVGLDVAKDISHQCMESYKASLTLRFLSPKHLGPLFIGLLISPCLVNHQASFDHVGKYSRTEGTTTNVAPVLRLDPSQSGLMGYCLERVSVERIVEIIVSVLPRPITSASTPPVEYEGILYWGLLCLLVRGV